MTRKEQLQAQLAAEAETTRKFIQAFPFDKKEYQVHEKSMKLGDIFLHVLDLALWAEMAVTTNEIDFETAPYDPKQLNSVEEAMNYFNECVEKGMNALKNTEDSVFDEKWTLRSGSTIYSVNTKEEIVRMAHNQTVHHRAQLGVNYRLLGIPVPQSYGPTADYPEFQ
ncbi:DinB family protein [Fluviicola taffensis]|uniref:DinB family protein n=1 Tax=Fluviicola taffensis TaxID=191579 RepID=UPI00313809C8